ncbi:MaoC/PaaZ C-terminal domain-containing protein [Actinomadura sp. 6K520]|uniref:MaoC family dehydratase n=1 Tax=Actinomadura sp. 6K520 TaxID=2530364 RepID=UPI0014053785|nr:MaoC/PaaZ C-terminal domain-containing protein [Actinomadura sp. 6K520]
MSALTGPKPDLKPVLPAAFAAGATLRTPGRTLTSGDFAAIINATWENGPLHTDDVYMSGTGFGRRILGGPCLLAIAAGLSSPTMYASWAAAGLDCHAALGIDEVRYEAPVFENDTITVDVEVHTLEPTPGGSAFVGRVRDVVRKQDGTAVLTMRRGYLLKPIAEDT